jgi:hypothetical protein
VGRGQKTECNMVGNLLEEEDFGNGIKLCLVGCCTPMFFFLVNFHTGINLQKSPYLELKKSNVTILRERVPTGCQN